MKKADMPPRGLEDRRIFLDRLESAGWNVERWDEALDAGANVDPEAAATHAGPVFDMRLEYHAHEGYILIEMIERRGDQVVRLRLYPKGDLATVLERITTTQDKIDADNYPDLVKSLIPVSDPLLIETDQGPYQLS